MNGMQIGMTLALLIFLIVGISTYVFVKKSGKRFIVAGKSIPIAGPAS